MMHLWARRDVGRTFLSLLLLNQVNTTKFGKNVEQIPVPDGRNSTNTGNEKDVLRMKKRQGKTLSIDTTGRVSSYLGSHQQ